MIHRTICRDGRDQSILMGGFFRFVMSNYYRADLWWRKFLTYDVVAVRRPDAELMTEQSGSGPLEMMGGSALRMYSRDSPVWNDYCFLFLLFFLFWLFLDPFILFLFL